MRYFGIICKRLLIKAIIYRCFVLIGVVGVLFFFSKDFKFSLGSGIIIELLNTLQYYLFEEFYNEWIKKSGGDKK